MSTGLSHVLNSRSEIIVTSGNIIPYDIIVILVRHERMPSQIISSSYVYSAVLIGATAACLRALTNFNFSKKNDLSDYIFVVNPQVPKVFRQPKTPKGGGYHPPGFSPSRPNFLVIFLMGMFSGSRNPTVIMKKFYLHCVILKIKVKHLFA